MIWSFVKIVFFVLIVAALTLGAGYLAETGSGMQIAVANKEITLGPVQMVIATLIAILGLWLIMRIAGFLVATIRFLNGDETALSRYFDRNRERKGYEALAGGMTALASGEGRLAMNQAVKAERYLRRPELTDVLLAQASELSGDRKRAGEVYKRLLGDDRTRFVGVRGLMRQKIDEGDTVTALKLAEKAFALKPGHQETQDTLLQLQTEKGDWKGARAVLGAKHRQGLLPRDVYRRRDAVMALQEAKGILSEDTPIEAREAAIEANRQSPDLIPAASLAARGYIEAGKPKYAARVLKKAWNAQPHPDLAAVFAAIAPDESPAARLRRFEPLLTIHPRHEETRLLRAELLIANEDFPAARRALGDLPETHPTTRSLAIRAAIARGEGESDALVRGWLTRALSASRGPQWTCDKCHNIQAAWAPTCDNCGGFDTLTWREPPSSVSSLPNGTDMLPLIVGPKSRAEAEAPPPPREIKKKAAPPPVAEGEVIMDEEVGQRP